MSLIKEVNAIIETLSEEEEGWSGMETQQHSNKNKIEITIAEDFKFFLSKNGKNFSITTDDDLLSDEWLNKINNYLSEGQKSIKDILLKADVLFNDVLDDDGDGDDNDDDDEDEEQEQDEDGDIVIEVDDDDMANSDNSIFENPAIKKEKQPSYDPKFESIKKQYGKFTNKSSNYNQVAVNRLLKDYLKISKNKNIENNGIRIKPRPDNIFIWDVEMFGFDKKDKDEKPLAEDILKYEKKYGKNFIHFEISYPDSFPYSPPFIRVIKPRFVFRTGHVTIGGSICSEHLTKSGWVATNSIENILIQIRAACIEGKGRIDFGNTSPYSMHEAKDAFFRVSKRYGWE